MTVSQPGQLSTAKSTGPVNGVLPVPAALLQRSSANRHGPSSKVSAPRLKLLVRRLAPGLTQVEFEEALGDEWKIGAGKVDWISFKPGKVSGE